MDVNDHVIAAILSIDFLLKASASDPVKKTIMANEVLNTGPAINEYLLAVKPGIASAML